MTLKEMLKCAAKKNAQYNLKQALKDLQASMLENIQATAINMRGVKEATGYAGAFQNFLTESSRVLGMDYEYGRYLGNAMQRLALDLKHTAGLPQSFKTHEWFKMWELKNSLPRNASVLTVVKELCIILGINYKEIEPELISLGYVSAKSTDDDDEDDWLDV